MLHLEFLESPRTLVLITLKRPVEKQSEGTTVMERKNLDAITWWVVGSESVTDDEIVPDGLCGVKNESFYKKGLGKAFLMVWPWDI